MQNSWLGQVRKPHLKTNFTISLETLTLMVSTKVKTQQVFAKQMNKLTQKKLCKKGQILSRTKTLKELPKKKKTSKKPKHSMKNKEQNKQQQL